MSKVALASLAAAAAALCALPALAQSPEPAATRDFVSAAAQSDQYEIFAGQDASAQTQNPRVRAFAAQMIQEHTQTSQALAGAAAQSRLPPPPKTLGGDQQKMLGALQSLRGLEFDRAYAKQQVLAHQQALVVEQGYATRGADPNVRQAAQSAVPLIQHHLQMAIEMRDSLGGA